MKIIKAKRLSYSPCKRDKRAVKYIVIHYTAGNNDTAVGEGNYFKNVNTRNAGAHFFVDEKGDIVKSIALDRIAWAVGGGKWGDCKKTGGAKLHNIATNYNSVSIELCDNLNKDPSSAQIKAVKKCIKYIRKYCPNATKVIRHFDVTGKHCPARMMDGKVWEKFLHDIGEK
jgi:N-acetylmuramoyl-L-alanine amidase CwlA